MARAAEAQTARGQTKQQSDAMGSAKEMETGSSDGVIGRQDEFDALSRFVQEPESGPHALVFEGEAGIGKTLLWRAGLELARASGRRVISCRPAESEADLSFAALADLLDPLLEEALPQLPDPQRRALEVALLRAERGQASPDRRAVGVAVLTILRKLAAAEPLLVAVDDMQWLDSASAAALEFALRRIERERLALLAAVRGPAAAIDLPLVLPEGRLQRRLVGPLTLGAVSAVLRSRLGVEFTRAVQVQIYEASRGNPFFALELGRALLRRGVALQAGEPLPVPDSLNDLVHDRLEALPASTRRLLLAASALAHPTLELMERVAGPERVRAQLARAARAGVTEVEAGRIRFSHPILSFVLYSNTPPAERRRLHRLLAEIVPDPEQRARHLALATDNPDARVAEALDEAAVSARLRGATQSAADLAELSCRLTPADDGAAIEARRLALGEYLFHAGDTQRARGVLEQLVDDTPSARRRAQALRLLAVIEHEDRSDVLAVEFARRALAEVQEDPRLRAQVHATLSRVCEHDLRERAEHAGAALELLKGEDEPEPALLAVSLASFAESEYLLGRGVRLEIVERALEIERRVQPARVAERTSSKLGQWLKYSDDHARARPLLEAAYQAALEEGDESSLPDVLSHLPELELWTGNWASALRYAREYFELSERIGQEVHAGLARYCLALVEAHLGHIDEALTLASEGVAIGERADENPWVIGVNLWALGFTELSRGDFAAVDSYLTRADEICERIGLVEPGQWRFHPEHIEALIRLGQMTRACALLERLEMRATAVSRPSALAAAGRCRALLLAAAGDMAGALEAGDRAAAALEGAHLPFEIARLLLARGSIHRRAKHWRKASDSLEQARSIFDDLGAPLWSTYAESELRRVGGRRASTSGLTATEEQIAGLIAAGRTAREVADALFLTPKGVEAHVASIYRKLGVRSRAELGFTLAGRDRPPVD